MPSFSDAPDGPIGDVTRLLAQVSAGDEAARAALFELLYRELRRLAESAMRAERRDHTLQPTALIHEAYVRLAGADGPFQNRAHFLSVAATVMRRVLVDHARARKAQKRGGGGARADVPDLDQLAADDAAAVDVVALDEALSRLAQLDPREARVVELRFFGGLSVGETAALLDVSERTVKREWQIARAWLRREMGHDPAR